MCNEHTARLASRIASRKAGFAAMGGLFRGSLKRLLLPLLLVSVLCASESAPAREVTIPLRVSYALLHQLLFEQIYIEPEGTAQVWSDATGCNFLTLSDPRVSEQSGRIRTLSAGVGRIGTPVGKGCLTLVDWKGAVEVFHEPVLEAGAPVVSFRISDSNVYDEQGRKGLTTGTLWDWVKQYVHPRFDRLRVDLNPLLAELRALVPMVLPGQDVIQIERSLASLAIERSEATPEGLRIVLRLDVPELATGEQPAVPAALLTEEELARWEAAWQRWDSFLTFVIRHAAADTTLQELRHALLEVLLDARYELREALTASTPGARDPVPALFLKTWDRLAAVLRQVGDTLPGDTALRYLAFISAADAMHAIDELGPTTGFEISADALRRLARMVAPLDPQDPLAYSLEVDPALRELFGFGPPLPPPEENPDLLLNLSPISTAFAAEAVPRAMAAKLNRWLPTLEELPSYLPLVRDLLRESAQATLTDRALKAPYHSLYDKLVLATAWQESCWRQFVKRSGKLTPLRSPAGAVGLMQVNAAVWRGFYDPKGLRQDIGYNARAGSEILLHYLVDYAIAKGEGSADPKAENLARATYAAYNGGPAHLSRYRKNRTPKSLQAIDDAFWEKYQTVKRGDTLAVAQCFGATLPTPTPGDRSRTG
jgi:hypothetical protein